MWMYFLFCLFATSQIAANGNETTIWSQILANGTSSAAPMILSGVSTSLDKSYRHAYKRDLLVVLPVMQGNSDLSDFNLQMLYTKTPVTAIIKEHRMNQSNIQKMKSSTTVYDTSTFVSTYPVTKSTFYTVTTPRIVEKQSERTTPAVLLLTKREESRPLNTNFIFTKPAPIVHKLPSKYSNPESLKFGQEVNKLPKNPKPGLAQTDIAPPENKWTPSVESTTQGNSFQMFESVEPLEIIKLLSLRPVSISVTDRIAEQTEVKKVQESSEIPNRFTKQPLPFKLSHKKPQKIKLGPQKVNDAQLISFTPTTVKLDNVETTVTSASTSTSTTTALTPSSPVITAPSITTASFITEEPGSTPSTPKSDNELYDTVRYSTLFAESAKEFWPTHSMSSPNQIVVTVQPIEKISTSSAPTANNWSTEASLVNSTTTPETFTLSPNFNLTNVNTTSDQVMETSPPPKEVAHIEPTNLVSLTKILDDPFYAKTSLRPLQSDIMSSSSVNPSFPTDMLTNDMKDMLVSLGILKSENDSSPVLFATSTAETSTISDQHQLFDSLFIQREPITPTIDPNSYTSFKKLPSIDYEQPQMNNDVRDLLSSFGLLVSTNSNDVPENSMLTRTSRQQKDNSSDSAMEMLDGNMRKTLENLGLLKSVAHHDQQHRNEHVFQPSTHLEKLADPLQVEKINSALETVRKLSRSKDAQNLTIEELEQNLRNVTILLHDENILNANEMHKALELVTKTSSSVSTFIFNVTTTSPEPTNSVTITSSPLTASFKSVITTPSLQASTTSASSVVDTSKGSTSNNSGKNNENNYRRRSSGESTTTAGTTTGTITITTTTTTIMPTTKSRNTSTMASFSETELNAENSTNSRLNTATSVTQSTTSPSPLNHNEVNETSDASYMSMIKQPTTIVTQPTTGSSPLEHIETSYMPDVSSVSLVEQASNDNKSSVVVSLPPNPLSVEELQNLLESNRNEVKRQQPQEEVVTTTSSSTSSGGSDSRTTSSNSDNGSSTVAETLIKDEVTNDNDPPLEALADSFGGENNEEQGDSWLANAKPNGLYFLLDWNTFLSVGEEDKNPIRIRFQPRAGNPRNFQPIRVP